MAIAWGETWAKQIEGAIVLTIILNAFDEDRLSGEYPKELAEREAWIRSGKLAYGIKVGDTWHSYRRFDPFNLPLAIIASGRQEMLEIIESNADPATKTRESLEVFTKLVSVTSNHIIDNSYMQAVASATQSASGTERFIGRTATTMIPYSAFFRTIYNSHQAATMGEIGFKEYETLGDYFGNVFPGIADDKVGVFGETMARKSSLFQEWLPLSMSRETDAVESKLREIGSYPGMPNHTMTSNGFSYYFDDDIYDEFVADYGPKAKARLARILAHPNVQRMSDRRQKQLVEKALEDTRGKIRTRYVGKQLRRLREQGRLVALRKAARG